jgi:hypothetical protein
MVACRTGAIDFVQSCLRYVARCALTADTASTTSPTYLKLCSYIDSLNWDPRDPTRIGSHIPLTGKSWTNNYDDDIKLHQHRVDDDICNPVINAAVKAAVNWQSPAVCMYVCMSAVISIVLFCSHCCWWWVWFNYRMVRQR